MGNVPPALISLSFSIICVWKPHWCIEHPRSYRRALIMEPCGVNCFLLQISQPVVDPCQLVVNERHQKVAWIVQLAPAVPGITQKCVTIPKSSASRRTLWKPICSKSPLSSEPCWGCCWSADCVLPCFYPTKHFRCIKRSFQIVQSDVAIGQPPPLSIESFWCSSSWYGSPPPSDIFAFEISDIEVAAYSDKEWQMQ